MPPSFGAGLSRSLGCCLLGLDLESPGSTLEDKEDLKGVSRPEARPMGRVTTPGPASSGANGPLVGDRLNQRIFFQTFAFCAASNAAGGSRVAGDLPVTAGVGA